MSTAAPLLLVDGDARNAVEHGLHRNLFVEAGAGTGKTTVLVKRVVRLVATGRLSDPSRLVAITFTEAAAAQLRDRIRAELERAGRDEQLPPMERQRCRAASAAIDEATVTTLHGFAQRILAEHALAAGLPPAFEVDEGIAAELAFAERWATFVDGLFADPALAPDLEVAATLGLVVDRLREVARLLHDRWDRLAGLTLVDPGPVTPIDAADLLAALRDVAELAGSRAGCDDTLVQLVERQALPALALLEAAAGTGDPLELLRVVDAVRVPRPGGKGRKELWGDDKGRCAAALEAAVEAQDALLAAQRRHVVGRLLPRLVAFTLEGATQRRRQGRLHYHDLLVHARDLLWRHAAVRGELARRYEVLLVDEFQDTDPLQVEIVFALAAADPIALPARWHDVAMAPGKVLVVGDPKQSIYGFRGADVGLWNRTRALFEPDVVHLRQNFRSVPSILAWVNAVFERLIGEGENATQPAYTPLSANRVNLDDDPAVVVVGGPAGDGVRAAEVRLQEGADVAAAIGALHRAGRRHADVAILVPTRTPLGALERALDDADIPYRVESRSLVWDTDVVRQLLAVLTAIEDPADEVAVVAALRSPAFACRDDELLAYRTAGGRWDPTRPPPDDLPDDHPVVAALAELRAWHERRWWVPVNELVDEVVRRRRLVELTLAQRRPRDHWRRLRFVVDQARAFVAAGGTSLASFLAWARLQADEGAAAVEAVVPEPDDDAVRILTVHGSKGLEFPVVVLAGLSTGAPPGGPAVLWAGERPEVRIPTSRGADRAFASAGFAAASEDAKRADEHESIRLLYVAATRAQDLLVVSLHHVAGGRGQRTHAGLLHRHCVELAGTWRPADLGVDTPRLLDAVPSAGAFALVPEREAWVARHDAALAVAGRSWSVAPTALAGLVGTGEADALDEPDEAAADPWDGDATPALARRGGTAVGRAVHAVLETVDLAGAEPVPSADVEALAERFALVEGIADAAPAVAALAASALASDALAEARAGRRLWREVPVVAPVGDRIVEGFVDLLYETAEGELVVVDWKTDRARSDAEVDAAIGRYRLQAAGYALALEVVVGRPVDRCRFVFCREGDAVERDVVDLAAAVDEARGVVLGAR